MLMKKYNTKFKLAIGIALTAAFLLIWINLAVGIIGDSDNPANLLYIGVIAVALIGSIVARFRPKGMKRALIVTACAQALVPIIVLSFGMQQEGEIPPLGTFILLHVFFVVMFIISAMLFRSSKMEGLD